MKRGPANSTPRSEHAPTPLEVLALFAFVATLVVQTAREPDVPADTRLLVRGADGLLGCLADGRFSGCEEAGPLPLLQYAPALVFNGLGLSTSGQEQALALTSTLAFAALLVILWRLLAPVAGGLLTRAVIAAVLTGPLIWYAHSSFGEMTATALIVLAVVCAVRDTKAVPLAVVVCLASFSKDTAPVFVAALVTVGILIRRDADARRPLVIATLAGAVTAIAASTAFNFFRFGALTNSFYLRDEFRVPGLGYRLDFAWAMWVSPNAGALFFWTSAVVMLVLALALTTGRWSLTRTAERRGAVANGAIATVLVVLTAGLASWWSPFGWVAWGPRLLIPWILPALILALLACRTQKPALQWRRPSNLALAALLAIGIALAVPHSFATTYSPAQFDLFTRTDALCPQLLVFDKTERDLFFDCLSHHAWSKRPRPLATALEPYRSASSLGLAGMNALALAAAAFAVRRRRTPPVPRPSPATNAT